MKKILVAEDDVTSRQFFRAVLKAAGYAVTAVSTGRAALQQLDKERFDLLLTDIWMPQMNGFELMAQLRERGAGLKVIVLTSDDTPESLLGAIREQAFNYLRKPVDRREMTRAVENALAQAGEPPPIEVISAIPNWVELLVPCDLQVGERITGFLSQLKADLPEEVREQVGHAFRELLHNAIEWGGKFDPDQKVRIACLRAERMLLYRIADPGGGFRFEGLEHAALKNPPDEPTRHLEVRADKGMRPGGFGLLMVKALVDELLYNEAQNEVIFIKYLSE